MVKNGDTDEAAPGLIWASRLVAVAAAAAVLLHYFGQRPLWLDEALVGLNLRYLGPDELLGRLDFGQVAGLGWVLFQSAAAQTIGDPELALRLCSALAGVMAVFVFRDLAMRLIGGLGGLVAFGAFGLSGVLVTYAGEAKPYALEVLLTTMALSAATPLLHRGPSGRSEVLALLVAGLGAVWLTLPVIYVLAGCGLVLAGYALHEGRRRDLGLLLAIGAAWLVLFAGLLFGVYYPQLRGNELAEGGSAAFFTRVGYAPLVPKSLADLTWYPRWLKDLLSFFYQDAGWAAAGVLSALGLASLARRRTGLALLLAAPVAIALVASGFHAYPLFKRLALFLWPIFALVLGFGVDALVRAAAGRRAPALAVSAVALIGALTSLAPNLLRTVPYEVSNTPGALQIFAEKAGPLDTLYVANAATPTFLFYRAAAGLARRPWAFGDTPSLDWDCVARDLGDVDHDPAIWLLIEPGPLRIDPPLAEAGRGPELVYSAGTTFLYRIDDPTALTDELSPRTPQPQRCLDGRTAFGPRVYARSIAQDGAPLAPPSHAAVDIVND